jgi:hypothetical protein
MGERGLDELVINTFYTSTMVNTNVGWSLPFYENHISSWFLFQNVKIDLVFFQFFKNFKYLTKVSKFFPHLNQFSNNQFS